MTNNPFAPVGPAALFDLEAICDETTIETKIARNEVVESTARAGKKVRIIHPEIMQGQEEPARKIEPVAPSAVFDSFFERTPPALTLEEIDDIIEAYTEGIR